MWCVVCVCVWVCVCGGGGVGGCVGGEKYFPCDILSLWPTTELTYQLVCFSSGQSTCIHSY